MDLRAVIKGDEDEVCCRDVTGIVSSLLAVVQSVEGEVRYIKIRRIADTVG